MSKPPHIDYIEGARQSLRPSVCRCAARNRSRALTPRRAVRRELVIDDSPEDSVGVVGTLEGPSGRGWEVVEQHVHMRKQTYVVGEKGGALRPLPVSRRLTGALRGRRCGCGECLWELMVPTAIVLCPSHAVRRALQEGGASAKRGEGGGGESGRDGGKGKKKQGGRDGGKGAKSDDGAREGSRRGEKEGKHDREVDDNKGGKAKGEEKDKKRKRDGEVEGGSPEKRDKKDKDKDKKGDRDRRGKDKKGDRDRKEKDKKGDMDKKEHKKDKRRD